MSLSVEDRLKNLEIQIENLNDAGFRTRSEAERIKKTKDSLETQVGQAVAKFNTMVGKIDELLMSHERNRQLFEAFRNQQTRLGNLERSIGEYQRFLESKTDLVKEAMAQNEVLAENIQWKV